MSRYSDIVKKETDVQVPDDTRKDPKPDRSRHTKFFPSLYNPVLLTSNPDYGRWCQTYVLFLEEMRHNLAETLMFYYQGDEELEKFLFSEEFFEDFCRFIRKTSSGKLI